MEIIERPRQNPDNASAARIIAISGRIDQTYVSQFEQALKPFLDTCTAGAAPLILDFSGVDYISSVGLRVLMLAARQVKAQNGKIVIAALTPVVAEVFQISRFNLVYQISDSVEAAIAALGK